MLFLVTQITNREFSLSSDSYRLHGGVREHRRPQDRRAGLDGRRDASAASRTSHYDLELLKAVVSLRIDGSYNQIPKDSDASILTAGLLGGQYVGLSPGGSEAFKDGDQIEFVQDAVVLENLISKYLFNSAASGRPTQRRDQRRLPPRSDGCTCDAIRNRWHALHWWPCSALRRWRLPATDGRAAAKPAVRRARARPAGTDAADLAGPAARARREPRGVRKDPQAAAPLVDSTCCRIFDVDYAARLVLGKHWRTATDEQRKRFVDAFYQSLMRNYGDAIVEFTADRLTILPFKGDRPRPSATVRTEVKRSNGTPVPVNYSMRATPQGWKAWDVTIEGISYVKNYRTDFGSEIDQKGIDAVIQRLEAQNASGAPDAPARSRRRPRR